MFLDRKEKQMPNQINDKLRSRVNESATDGRLSCSTALKIADEFNLAPREVGRAANLLKIKIVSCQLGCFK